MMKTFICLANSFKYGGRCLGGIEIILFDNSYSVIRNTNGTPKWIRPVSLAEHGQLPLCETNGIEILDIISVEVTGECPVAAHSENCYYSSLIKTKKKCSCSIQGMNNICNNNPSLIFFNRGKAVISDIFLSSNFSLMLIKPENPAFSYDSNNDYKLRVTFSYKGNKYDLPITDPEFIETIKTALSLDVFNDRNDYYFTVSLGEEHNGWHYKLIAGIIETKEERRII